MSAGANRFWLAIAAVQTLLVAALVLGGLALALAACGQMEQRRAADGYVFEGAEWHRPDIDVRFVLHRSQRELVAAYPGPGLAPGAELKAWSSISLEANRCTVHIVDPAVDYRPEWIGHEITHCLTGNWHRPGEAGRA